MTCCCNNHCCHCCHCCNRCTCNCCKPPGSTCQDCKICPVSGCPNNKNCEWYPIEWTEDPEKRRMRRCCDETGCCGLFPEECRNKFWPEFAHPRWLCCKDLYCARKANQAYCKKCK